MTAFLDGKFPDQGTSRFLFGGEGKHMVHINGEDFSVEGETVAAYLAYAGYDPQRVAVERNGEIVPRARYSEVTFQAGDCVEIVRFVGGG